jgi:predicted PurR-regulated permease PerM
VAEQETLSYEEFKDRLWLTLGVILVGVLIFLVMVFAAQVVFMAFIGVILALLFGGMAHSLAKRTPLSETVALVVVLVAIGGGLAAFLWFIGPQIGSQFAQLSEQLPDTLSTAREWLSQYGWGQTLLERMPDNQQLVEFLLSGSVTSSATRFVTSAVGIITGAVLVLFLGIFLAFRSSTYVDGLLHLFPLPSRDRMDEVLYAIGRKLKGWISGRGIAMALVGITIYVGLALLGVPVPLALAVLAALLTFIPNWGPTLAAVPSILLAFTQSPQKALFVVLLYVGAQLLLQYAVNPLILKEHSNLPAAVVIITQVLMTVLFGVLGLIVAAPIVAVVMVVVKMLYVEDVLGDDVKITVPGAS